MIARNRIKCAMSFCKPDRTPVMCQPSWGHILLNSKIEPVDLWHEPEAYAAGLLWVQRNYGFDGILMSVNGFDPEWHNSVLKSETVSGGIRKITFKNDNVLIYPKDDLPFSPNMDRKAFNFECFDPMSISTDIPTYLPVSQGLAFEVSSDSANRRFLIEYLTKETKGEISLHGEIYSPFDYFLDLFGLEQALMSMLLDSGKCREVISRFTQSNVKYAQEMIKAGCDAIKISSPYAGQGFISKSMYAEFVMPFESQIVAALKNMGAAVYVHTCGSIGDRLELIRNAGFSGIECLDPPPLGNVLLEDAVKRIGQDMFIKGNIDSVNTLLPKTAAECKRDALERIRIGKNAKGYILSTACSIAPRVPPENLIVLVEAAEEAD